MILKVIGSSSAGNAYILDSGNEALLIEVGLRFEKVKKALGFNLKKVAGLLLSHSHSDHSKGVIAAMAAGINVYSSHGTFEELGILKNHRAKAIQSGVAFKLGNFQVKAFDVKHDVAQPFGYIIHHPECGNVVFVTDTHYVPYTFRDLNNIIVECNYSERILAERLVSGETNGFIRNRVIGSHMSFETCQEFLAASDLSEVNNIVLIHLSDAHSDADLFQREISIQTGRVVTVADRDMDIPFDLQPF